MTEDERRRMDIEAYLRQVVSRNAGNPGEILVELTRSGESGDS